MKTPLLFLVASCALAAPAVAGPDWVEREDAGSNYTGAQRVVGVGTPLSISGTLSTGLIGDDLEDVYLISITSPGTFKFDLRNSTFDSMIHLFNVTQAEELFGLLANNDSAFSPGSYIGGPMATDGSGAMVLNPGIYALAISGFNRHPVSRTGDIFLFTSLTETSGPDGPGGINPLEGWVGTGETGSYNIIMEGVGYVDVPAPGAAALLGLCGVTALRRRRR
jgi:MYXO-CTERM domain-containing protein